MSPEVLHQDLADFRVSHPDLTLLQYVDDILLTAETEQECLQAMDQVMQFVEPSRQFVKDSIRLVKRCTKPDRKEFQKIAMATAIGFAIMGFIGFFVKLIHIPINNIIVNSPSLMRNVTVYSDGFCTVCQDFFFFKDDLPARAACSEVSSSFLFCSFTVLDLTSKAEVPVELNFV
ncbi:hypothetical protein STEG23_027788 [Scotinomys teguina]